MSSRASTMRTVKEPAFGRGQFQTGPGALRARAEINSHFGASAGRAHARRRDEGDVGHRRGAATTPIRALRRRALPGCGPRARWLCCSLLTYRPGYSSSLAPRPQAWGPAADCKFISARALRSPTSAVAVQVKMGLVNRRVRRPGLESSLQASLTRYRLSLNSEPRSSVDEHSFGTTTK